MLAIAEEFAIKNPKGIVAEVQKLIPRWSEIATELDIPSHVIERIRKDFMML